jgi:hypothetical protein
MNPAKLRRSQNVSDTQRSKIENRFKIRDLAMFQHGLGLQARGHKLVNQVTNLIAKLPMCARHPTKAVPLIISGRDSPACRVSGVGTV